MSQEESKVASQEEVQEKVISIVSEQLGVDNLLRQRPER